MLPKYLRVIVVAAAAALSSGQIYSTQLSGSVDPDTSNAANQSGPRNSEEQMPVLITAVSRAEASAMANRDDAAEPSLWKTYEDLNQRTVPLILELARRKPETEEAFAGLAWIVTNRQVTAGDPRLSKFGKSAMELLLSHHCLHPRISQIFHAASGGWTTGHRPTATLLRSVADKHPDRTTRGQATFALGLLKKHNVEWLEGAEQEAKRTERDPASDETYRSLIRMGDFKTQKAEAITLLESAIQDYAEVPTLPRATLRKNRATIGDQAQSELFELTRLGIGCVAPEIEGVDLQGRSLRLSDFKGKIVLLTYWASWCGPCMQLVKHERTLFDRFAGQPFVIVGVNGDASSVEAIKVAENAGIVWPSFWSGPEGPNGSIPTQWNVHGWPTVYLLDAKGVIRLKYAAPSVIEETVTRLLKEMENSL